MEGKIFVTTHKKVAIPLLEGHPEYELIQTGNTRAASLGYKSASEGENIADENTFYADLTVHYWIWKNCNYDYVGINHYRRFLFYNHHLITDEEIRELLGKYDVLVPKKLHMDMTVEEQFNKWHDSKDMALAVESMKRHYPDSEKSFTEVMNAKEFHICNIFIAKQAVFNEYCEWIFPILEDVKEQIDLSKFTCDSARRVGGFLSERLFNVWLHYTNHSTYELQFIIFYKDQFDVT